jgi:hypothetical protein
MCQFLMQLHCTWVKLFFACKQTRDQQDGGNGHCVHTAGIRAAGIGRSVVKCNCHRLKIMVQYYKRVIALKLQHSNEYCFFVVKVQCNCIKNWQFVPNIKENIWNAMSVKME